MMGASATWHVIFPRLSTQQAANRPTVPCGLSWTRRLTEDVRNIPRYCLKYGVAVLALLGLTQVWQAGGDGPIAPFRTLSSEAQLTSQRVSSPRCMFARTDTGIRRTALAPALAILDEVHPDVALWVRDTDRRGKLQFADSWQMPSNGSSCLARYDTFRGILTISPGTFAESDGRMATILCHEYRHARQRFSKTIVYVLSYLWQRGGDPSLVENDALLFEQEAHLAVFGHYLDP